MRYTVILLLLSACASLPESQTETSSSGDSYIGPSNWGYGYAQGTALSFGATCFYPGYPAIPGPAYSSSYNCAAPLLFYSRSPYYSYYSALAPVTPAYGAHPWRRRALGASSGVTTAVARATPGSPKKRK